MKPRRHDLPARIEHFSARERVFADRGNAFASNADIANPVQPRLGIHHLSVLDHEVVLRRPRAVNKQENETNRGGNPEHAR